MNHSSPDEAGLPDDQPSKTRRKQKMHALQDLGEALLRVAPERLAQLDLPERLRDALAEAGRITSREARRRQMQYLGRLMRDVDAAPLRMRLEEWAQGPRRDTAALHRLEAWRDRLLADPKALDELCAAHPEIDRTHLRTLILRASEERQTNQPPRHYRQLFRELKSALEASS